MRPGGLPAPVEYFRNSFLPRADRPLVAQQVWRNLLGGRDFDRRIDLENDWQQSRKDCRKEVQRMIKRKEQAKLRYDLPLRDRGFSVAS